MKQRAFTLIELLVVIAIIAILAAILFPVFARARNRANMAKCLNNLKQLGVAFGMYTDDNRGQLPGAWADDRIPQNNWAGCMGPSRWTYIERGQLYPYTRNAGIYICPLSVNKKAVSITQAIPAGLTNRKYPLSYSMNSYLSSRKPDGEAIQNPSLMMLLIEEARDTETGGIGINDCVYMTDQNYTNDQPGIVHYDGTNILYLDGHARWKRALELRRDQDNREWILPQVISG